MFSVVLHSLTANALASADCRTLHFLSVNEHLAIAGCLYTDSKGKAVYQGNREIPQDCI